LHNKLVAHPNAQKAFWMMLTWRFPPEAVAQLVLIVAIFKKVMPLDTYDTKSTQLVS